MDFDISFNFNTLTYKGEGSSRCTWKKCVVLEWVPFRGGTFQAIWFLLRVRFKIPETSYLFLFGSPPQGSSQVLC